MAKIPRSLAGGADLAAVAALLALAPQAPLLPAAKPKVEAPLAHVVAREGQQGGPLHLCAAQKPGGWTIITCTNSEGAQVWTDLVSEQAVCLAGTGTFAAVACVDGALSSLYLYSSAGRRLIPSIALEGRCAMLEANGSFLLAVLSDGQCRVWDVLSMTELTSFGLASVMRGAPGEWGAAAVHTAVGARVSGEGVPVITLSNGCSYTHHRGMRCVIRVADGCFAASSLFSHGALLLEGKGPLGRAAADAHAAKQFR